MTLACALHSHITLAHAIWGSFLKPGDLVVDATAGNGQDTLFLAKQILKENEGALMVCDIQKKAIQSTYTCLEKSLPREVLKQIQWHQMCHSQLKAILQEKKPQLIVYNLGYLPGGDKSLTTKTNSTIKSIEQALEMIAPHGMISITAYPGHVEGEKEFAAIYHLSQNLKSSQWQVSFFQQPNRKCSPCLFIIQKN